MSDPWVGILSTLIGAATGMVSSAITMTIQARQTNRVALKKRAIELALEDYRFRVNDKTGRVDAMAVSALIYYYGKLIDLATPDQLDGPRVQSLLREQWQLQLAANAEAERLRASEERRARRLNGPRRWRRAVPLLRRRVHRTTSVRTPASANAWSVSSCRAGQTARVRRSRTMTAKPSATASSTR